MQIKKGTALRHKNVKCKALKTVLRITFSKKFTNKIVFTEP